MSQHALRIGYLSHASIPSAEANSIQVMKMCAAFARRCDELVLYCRATGALDAAHAHYGVEPGFRLVGTGGRRIRVLGRALYSLRVLAQLRRDTRAELLYGRDYHTLALAALAGVRVPMALEVHQPPQGALERLLLRALFRNPRFLRLIVISRALESEYLRLFGELLRGRTTVAHDGADPPGDGDADGDAPRAADAPLTLGYVGNLYPGKGMETIEQLAPRLPECRFHVIGGQPHEVALWQERIGRAHVVFHGLLPHAEAQARMRACDVLLAPFQRFVWIGGDRTDIGRWMSPLKVFEYMASGRPMIASDLSVLREVLHDGENALLVDPEDTEAWVRAIRRLAGDATLRRGLAARAREDLARHYTWDRRAELILDELRVRASSREASLSPGCSP